MERTVSPRLHTLKVEIGSAYAGVASAPLCECIHHAVFSMLPAVHRRVAALDTEGRPFRARGVQAKLSDHVDHTLLGMLLAVHRCLAPRAVETCYHRAALVRATQVPEKDHAPFSMLFTKQRRLAAPGTVCRRRGA